MSQHVQCCPRFGEPISLASATANPNCTPGGKHTKLSQNPLCTEIHQVGHQGFCKVLFGLRLKFIIDLKGDLPSHFPVPAYSCAACSVLPFKPCWRRCWRARAVCPYENQTLLSYQNKARLAVSLSARGEGKKRQTKKRAEEHTALLSFLMRAAKQLQQQGPWPVVCPLPPPRILIEALVVC